MLFHYYYSFIKRSTTFSLLRMNEKDLSREGGNTNLNLISRSELIYGKKSCINGFVYLPFPKGYFPPINPNAEMPVNPGLIPESCGSKIITGCLTGGVLGLGLGLFMGAMGDVSPIQIINGREVPQAPLREQIRSAFKGTAAKSIGWGKNFAVLTALFGGIECVIEKYRAKHDVWNAVFSGCAVGATLSAKAGPAAACVGCVGFGGFSLVVDKVMSGIGH